MRAHALAFAASQRPPAVLNEKRDARVAAHARLGRLGEHVAGSRPRSRRRSPDTSAASCRSASDRLPARGRPAPSRRSRDSRASCSFAPRRAAERGAQVVVQHVARQRRLARARNAGHDHEPAERHAERLLAQVVQRCSLRSSSAGDRAVDCAPLRERMAQRLREQSAGDRFRRALQLLGRARGDDVAAARARAGPEIDDVVGAPDRVLVVLDHEQRIALRREPRRAYRAGCGCRADAGRWSARRGCSTRPADSSPAAPRAGCAAPRRPTASAPSGRARDSRARPLRGTPAAS